MPSPLHVSSQAVYFCFFFFLAQDIKRQALNLKALPGPTFWLGDWQWVLGGSSGRSSAM